MRKAANILYIVGKVLAIISIVTVALCAVAFGILLAFSEQIGAEAAKAGDPEWASADPQMVFFIIFLSCLIAMVLVLGIEIAGHIVVETAHKRIVNGDLSKSVRIMMVVGAALMGNECWLISGIFEFFLRRRELADKTIEVEAE